MARSTRLVILIKNIYTLCYLLSEESSIPFYYTINGYNNDNRPYAEVMLLDRVVVGLLVTGAAINVIGGKLAEQLIRSKVPF